MKKILIFHACLPPYRIDLFNTLSEHFKAKAVLFGRPSHLMTLGFDIKQIEEKAKIKYVWRNMGFFMGNHLISNMYFDEIMHFKPDIVLCQELGINTLATIIGKFFFKYKIAIFVDDSPGMLEAYSVKRRILRWLVYKLVDEVLVANVQVRDKLEAMFHRQRFFYLPIIQDECVFQHKLEACQQEVEHYVHDYGLTDVNVFLFVGRFEAVKQPLMLLDAFCKANLDNSKLVFVGDGTLKEQLCERVKLNGVEQRVIVLGKLCGSQLYAWFRIAKYLVLPSCFEPFGAVVNEALISGCKVIISDMVGASTLVNDHNGIVFQYNNEEALVEILKKCAKDVSPKVLKNKMCIDFGQLTSDLVENLNQL